MASETVLTCLSCHMLKLSDELEDRCDCGGIMKYGVDSPDTGLWDLISKSALKEIDPSRSRYGVPDPFKTSRPRYDEYSYDKWDLPVITERCPWCNDFVKQRMNRTTKKPFINCSRWPDCGWSREMSTSEYINKKIEGGFPVDPGTKPIKGNPIAEAKRAIDAAKKEAENRKERERRNRTRQKWEKIGYVTPDVSIPATLDPKPAPAKKTPTKPVKPPKPAPKVEVDKRFANLDFGDDEDSDDP